jgi:hypothetical protein
MKPFAISTPEVPQSVLSAKKGSLMLEANVLLNKN